MIPFIIYGIALGAMTLVNSWNLFAPNVIAASRRLVSIFFTPNMTFVRSGKKIPMNTTNIGPML